MKPERPSSLFGTVPRLCTNQLQAARRRAPAGTFVSTLAGRAFSDRPLRGGARFPGTERFHEVLQEMSGCPTARVSKAILLSPAGCHAARSRIGPPPPEGGTASRRDDCARMGRPRSRRGDDGHSAIVLERYGRRWGLEAPRGAPQV